MSSGIYCIEHVASGKVYVGSAVDFDKRWGIHRHHLRHNKHHSDYLQHAWNKYGEGAFEFKKLITCEKPDLIFWEQLFINGHEACNRDRGYNCAPIAGSTLGCKPSPQALANQRAGFKKRPRRPQTEETRKRIGAAHKGRKYSVEFRENTRAAHATKLDAAKAEEIRLACSVPATRGELAEIKRGLEKKHGITRGTINDIVRGDRWAPILPGSVSRWRTKNGTE